MANLHSWAPQPRLALMNQNQPLRGTRPKSPWVRTQDTGPNLWKRGAESAETPDLLTGSGNFASSKQPQIAHLKAWDLGAQFTCRLRQGPTPQSLKGKAPSVANASQSNTNCCAEACCLSLLVLHKRRGETSGTQRLVCKYAPSCTVPLSFATRRELQVVEWPLSRKLAKTCFLRIQVARPDKSLGILKLHKPALMESSLVRVPKHVNVCKISLNQRRHIAPLHSAIPCLQVQLL